MALTLIYRMFAMFVSLIGLHARPDTTKEIEILILRPRVSQFLALSLVRGAWGHAGDAWFVDLGA